MNWETFVQQTYWPEFVETKYNPNQARNPRGSGRQSGEFSSNGATAGASRSDRARASHKVCSRDVQKIADDMEAKMSKQLGLARTGDNAPFDLLQGKTAVEIKTIVRAGNDKITMHPESLQRKVSFAKKNKVRPFTLAIDRRGDKPIYYAAKGLGSFRLGSMQRFDNIKALQEFIR